MRLPPDHLWKGFDVHERGGYCRLLYPAELSLLPPRSTDKKQVQFGSPLPNSFSHILKLRIPHPPHLRDTLLAKRWTQAELLQAGLVDEVVDGGKLLNVAVERAVIEGAKIGAGAWGTIKVSH